MNTPEQLAEQIAAGRRGELADFDLVAMIRAFEAEVRAAERERCAKEIERLGGLVDSTSQAFRSDVMFACATAIRALTPTTPEQSS